MPTAVAVVLGIKLSGKVSWGQVAGGRERGGKWVRGRGRERGEWKEEEGGREGVKGGGREGRKGGREGGREVNKKEEERGREGVKGGEKRVGGKGEGRGGRERDG